MGGVATILGQSEANRPNPADADPRRRFPSHDADVILDHISCKTAVVLRTVLAVGVSVAPSSSWTQGQSFERGMSASRGSEDFKLE